MKLFCRVFGFACVVLLVHCSTEELTGEEVKRILLENKAYPVLVEYKIFCGSNADAKRLRASGLPEQGLVVARQAHTLEDVGSALISFTEKAKPYLIETSDTLKSIDVQKVKIADEQLHDVTTISLTPDRKNAVVEYTTDLVNITPFSVLLQHKPQPEQKRKTYFARRNGQWVWTGRVVKMP